MVQGHFIWGAAGLGIGFLAANAAAYRHAYRLLNFAAAGAFTPSPEKLSAWRKAAVILTGVTLPRPAGRSTPAELGMAFETVRVPMGAGQSLEAWSVRAAEPLGTVILFHGYGSEKSTLLSEMQAFLDLGYSVVAVDFRGGGGSTGETTGMGWREADDVAAVLRHVRDSGAPGPVVLFGKSMGAAAVLRALSLPGLDADRAIVEAPFDRLLTSIGRRFRAMGLPAFPLAQMLAFWGGRQAGFDPWRHAPIEYGGSIRVPVLLIVGSKDPYIREADIRAIAAAIGPSSRVQVLPNAAHDGMLQAEPEGWRAAVSSFISAR